MKPEAQRIAIAEACGWSKIQFTGTPSPDRLVGKAPDANPDDWFQVPDYLNDLNAMRVAESAIFDLSTDLWDDYANWLVKVVNDPDNASRNYCRFVCAHADSLQRAEATLRTLNLWK